MPRKVRQLRAELARNGFVKEAGRGKGSHTYWTHPLLPHPVVLSGHDGDDADHYQERDVRNALRAVREAQKRQQP